MHFISLLQKFHLPKAILIDLDGTLLDSHSILFSVYCTFLAHFGKLSDRYQLPPSEEKLKHLYFSLLERYYQEEATLFPGSVSFLELAKNLGIELAIVTSSKEHWTRTILRKHKIEKYFSFVITSQNLEASKPSPLIYQKALTIIDSPAEDVWAIEDSSSGIQAATGAHIQTLAFGKGHQPNENNPVCKSWEDCCFFLSFLSQHTVLFAQREPFFIKAIEERHFYPKDLEQEVDKIWEEEQKKKKHFNGWFFQYKQVKGNELEGFFNRYKYALAQQIKPELFEKHQIIPVAASGIVRAGKSLLLGRRSQQVNQYAGCLELVPSGSLDRNALEGDLLNAFKQLAQELKEETGLEEKEILHSHTGVALYDHQRGLVEIILELLVHEECLNRRLVSSEYSHFEWISMAEINEFIAKHKEECVPLSLSLLKFYTF
jgi:HAD superfamily hydrolase (TIGR01509 family)